MAVLASHRFSTIRMADRILMFHQGSLIEKGTRRKSVAMNGRYAEIFNASTGVSVAAPVLADDVRATVASFALGGKI